MISLNSFLCVTLIQSEHLMNKLYISESNLFNMLFFQGIKGDWEKMQYPQFSVFGQTQASLAKELLACNPDCHFLPAVFRVSCTKVCNGKLLLRINLAQVAMHV